MASLSRGTTLGGRVLGMTDSRSSRVTLLHVLTASLAAGATIGLIATVLSPLVRRWGGVSNRDLINGASVVGLSVALWLVFGVLCWMLRSRVQRPVAATIVVAVAVGALATIAILNGIGPSPLAPYPTRFASLAVPLIVLIVLGGAALFLLALQLPSSPLRGVAPGMLVTALVVGGVVYSTDRVGAVRYTLTAAHANAPVAPAATGADAAGSAAPTVTGAGAAAATESALHFSIAPSSEVAYTVTEKVNKLPAPSDAIGKTQTISGDVWLTQQGLDTSHTSAITVDLRTLKSNDDRRDQYLLTKSLESNTYPNAVFTIQGITGFPANYQQGTAVNVTLSGIFAVHGQQETQTWTGSAVYNGSQLEVVLSMTFDMATFGVTPPSTQFVQVQSGVKLDAHLYLAQQSQ